MIRGLPPPFPRKPELPGPRLGWLLEECQREEGGGRENGRDILWKLLPISAGDGPWTGRSAFWVSPSSLKSQLCLFFPANNNKKPWRG